MIGQVATIATEPPRLMNLTSYVPLPSSEFAVTLAAARQGDKAAIEFLVERYYLRVQKTVHEDLSRDLRRSRPWLTSRFSTGDVVHEVFRSLLNDLSRFEGKTEIAFCGYLAMIIRNRLLDAIRFHEAAQRDGRRSAAWSILRDFDTSDCGPVDNAAIAESAATLQKVLESLPEKERLLLRARIEQGTQFVVLAERLGYPSKWAARRAFYAVQSKVLILMGMHTQEEK
ncbi:MAG: RNA polymerase sigma factor (sigma-70 family) [Planctomycetota bacterium]